MLPVKGWRLPLASVVQRIIVCDRVTGCILCVVKSPFHMASVGTRWPFSSFN